VNGQGKDLISVLAWGREHLTLTPDQEEFLAAWFDERPDPRELRPVPIPEEELQPYRAALDSYLRKAATRHVIDEVRVELDETAAYARRQHEDARPGWLDPELWDHLGEACLDAQRSRVWGRRWYGDVGRPQA
jgi:hypothetical protein